MRLFSIVVIASGFLLFASHVSHFLQVLKQSTDALVQRFNATTHVLNKAAYRQAGYDEFTA